jgi:hypothetical protein
LYWKEARVVQNEEYFSSEWVWASSIMNSLKLSKKKEGRKMNT